MEHHMTAEIQCLHHRPQARLHRPLADNVIDKFAKRAGTPKMRERIEDMGMALTLNEAGDGEERERTRRIKRTRRTKGLGDTGIHDKNLGDAEVASEFAGE